MGMTANPDTNAINQQTRHRLGGVSSVTAAIVGLLIITFWITFWLFFWPWPHHSENIFGLHVMNQSLPLILLGLSLLAGGIALLVVAVRRPPKAPESAE